jgi:hypothetical protein
VSGGAENKVGSVPRKPFEEITTLFSLYCTIVHEIEFYFYISTKELKI